MIRIVIQNTLMERRMCAHLLLIETEFSGLIFW